METKIGSDQLKKSLEYLQNVSKAMGTQLSQGRQKEQAFPRQNIDHLDTHEGQEQKDRLDDNGTDYQHREELESSTSVGDKSKDGDQEEMDSPQFAQSRALRPRGSEVTRKGMKKGEDEEKEEKEEVEKAHDDEEEDKKLFTKLSKEKAEKSLESQVQTNETLRKGVEVSSFLAEFAKAQILSDGRIDKSVSVLADAMGQFMANQQTFNEELAKAVEVIGKIALNQESRLNKVASQPTAPKSQTQVMAKSVGGNVNAGQPLNKSQILASLEKGVIDGHIGDFEVVKFETTGILSQPAQSYLASNARHGA